MSVETSVKAAFAGQFGQPPAIMVRAPGRVNLLGEHVDYSQGWVLPGAIDRAIWLAARPVNGRTVTIYALDYDERQQFNLDQLRTGLGMGSWLAYPMGVAWTLMNGGHSLTGMEVVFTGDIPIGAGVSSSAALEIAFILAWETFASFTLTGIERAQFGQQVENVYLGLQSGIMDQFASLHGAAGHALLLDCRSLAHSLVALPVNTTIVIADSGVRRELIHSEYNDRQEECTEAVAILRRHLPQIVSLRDVTPELLTLHAHRLPLHLRRRVQHVVGEYDRVLTGVESLRQGKIGEFGLNMRYSHVSLRDLYEVSIPELDTLAVAAWQTPGCFGARLMGAGFGGCILALVKETAVADLQYSLESSFEQEYGRPPDIFSCQLADCAAVVPVA